MGTKWAETLIHCRWCGDEARVGIEKDGKGNTYRVMCSTCGIMLQVGFTYPAGLEIATELSRPAWKAWSPRDTLNKSVDYGGIVP